MRGRAKEQHSTLEPCHLLSSAARSKLRQTRSGAEKLQRTNWTRPQSTGTIVVPSCAALLDLSLARPLANVCCNIGRQIQIQIPQILLIPQSQPPMVPCSVPENRRHFAHSIQTVPTNTATHLLAVDHVTNGKAAGVCKRGYQTCFANEALGSLPEYCLFVSTTCRGVCNQQTASTCSRQCPQTKPRTP